MKEKQIEKKVCDFASSLGWLVRKYSSQYRAGMPDRIFMRDGQVFWIEFKKPGGKVSPIQQFEIETMQAHGMEVFIVDDVEHGKQIVATQTEGHRDGS